MASIALKRNDSFSSHSGGSNSNAHLCAEDLGYGDHHAPAAPRGLDRSTLASLQYGNQGQPQQLRGPGAAYQRQPSLRSSNLGYGGMEDDDYSLAGTCDVSSIRSDKYRPGRRASLSAAIELTKEPPKRNNSGSRPRGRRNSMFGNKASHEESAGMNDNSERTPPRSKSGGMLSKIGRRASMAAPTEAVKNAQPAEPEPTPQFFHKRKGKSANSKADKNDPRGQHVTSQLRPGEKIKRPKNNRRASLSAVSHGGVVSGAASNRSSGSEEDEFLVMNRMAPPRSASYGNPRQKYLYNNAQQQDQPKANAKEIDKYGYEIDPELPPPPSPSVASKRARQNRRGSTGTGLAAFMGSSSARASLKDSLRFGGRRGSTASSVATSTLTDTTDVTSNQLNKAHYNQYNQLRQSSAIPLPQRSSSPEPDLLGTPEQEPKRSAKLQGNNLNMLQIPPGSTHSEKPTPVQSNRKTRDAAFHSQNNVSLSASFGDSKMLDDMSLGGNSEHSRDQHEGIAANGNHHSKQLRSSTHTQRASLVKLDQGLGAAKGSALGFNPYGNKAGLGRSESEESEDEDDEDDYNYVKPEPKQNQKEFQKELKRALDAPHSNPQPQEKNSTVPPMDSSSKPSKESESNATNNLTADALATTGGTVTTEDDDDEHSNGSMTSEVPQEGIPKVSLEGENEERMEEIGATGDWSHGVQDYMYQATGVSKKNSLLDRYPGSIDDNDLGYESYMHNTKDPMDAYDDESERRIEGDISALYAEDYSGLSWRERPARSPESMEFINMEQLMSKAKNTKRLYIPSFIPAHGCTNASDFIVRCFVARLRAGVTVTKHSRSRWCKSHDRILHILPTGYHITWIPETEDEAIAKSTKKPPTKLDLTKCLEIRHAWSRDPKTRRYTGTSTLRSKCKEGTANRSFALIYPNRTVDFTAMTVDQCKILMEGFSALCFRLQMAKLEQQDNDDQSFATGISGMDNDDDSTTASLTTTNMSAPWGL